MEGKIEVESYEDFSNEGSFKFIITLPRTFISNMNFIESMESFVVRRDIVAWLRALANFVESTTERKN